MRSGTWIAGFGRLAGITFALLVCASAPGIALAQAERTDSPEVDRAARNAAIRRILADRANEASSLGRATAAIHSSLSTSSRLARSAGEDLGRGLRFDESAAIRELLDESRNLRAAYDALQSALAQQQSAAAREPLADLPRDRDRTSRLRSEGVSSSRSQARGARPVAVDVSSAFDGVRRVLELEERLEQSRDGRGSPAASRILAELQTELDQLLQTIRREPRPPTGVVITQVPEVRREPIRREPDGK